MDSLISKLPGTSVRLGFVSPKCGSYCIVNLDRLSNELHADTDDNPLQTSEEPMFRRDATPPLTASGQPVYRRSPSPPFQHMSADSSPPMQGWIYTSKTAYSPSQILSVLAESVSPVIPTQAHTQDHVLHASQTPLREHEPADMAGLAGNRDCSMPSTDILSGLTPGLCTFCGAAPGSLRKKGGFRQFRRCKRCKSADYCSEKCQRKDWQAGHKQKCREAPEQPAPPLSSDTIPAKRSAKSTHSGASGLQAYCSPPLATCPGQCFECGAAWGSADRRGNARQFRCCLRCKIAEYCSDECQQRHWNAKHAKECPDAVEIPSENTRGSLTPQTSPAEVSVPHIQRRSSSPQNPSIALNMAHEPQLAFLRAPDLPPPTVVAAYGVRRDVPDVWAQQLHNTVFPNLETAPLLQGPGQQTAYFNPFAAPPNILGPTAVPPICKFLAL